LVDQNEWMKRRFSQVDVFASAALRGNPLAVVIDGEGHRDAETQHVANWTNLFETTFLFPPTHPEADSRVRIFTAFFPLTGE
jgi:PhzF family phenazine biosynthesis protein